MSWETSVWYGCYTPAPPDLLPTTAKAHPAKMAWGLALRLIAHAKALGWLTTTHLVFDPMAGVGITGLACSVHGISSVLGELEPLYLDAMQATLARHLPRLAALGKPVPTVLRHDARALPLMHADLVLSSPPYVRAVHGHNGIDPAKLRGGARRHSQVYVSAYGVAPATPRTGRGSGLTPILTSYLSVGACRQTGAVDPQPGSMPGSDRGDVRRRYGTLCHPHPAQIGHRTGRAYWDAMAQVYRACYTLLPDGGHLLLVVKGTIQRQQYLDVPARTAALLEQSGFVVHHWHRVMLTAQAAQMTLEGREEHTARMSFFRRLHTKKYPHLFIDHEVVLCAEKPVRGRVAIR